MIMNAMLRYVTNFRSYSSMVVVKNVMQISRERMKENVHHQMVVGKMKFYLKMDIANSVPYIQGR